MLALPDNCIIVIHIDNKVSINAIKVALYMNILGWNLWIAPWNTMDKTLELHLLRDNIGTIIHYSNHGHH